jgi:hypothetical protein
MQRNYAYCSEEYFLDRDAWAGVPFFTAIRDIG